MRPPQNTSETVLLFQRNAAEYVWLRDRLERSLPPLDPNPTMLQIHAHRDALRASLVQARADAKKGAVFGTAMGDYIRSRVQSVLDGPDGAQIRQSLMDENPTTAVVEINRRYPFAVPVSRMPSALLKELPPLPEGLEYHFVGRGLILHDAKAQMVVDVIDNVLARTRDS